MRDLLVALIVFGFIPLILARPYVGVLVWSWFSYMNPHRLTWGFAFYFPFAKFIAIALLISLVFSKERKHVPTTPLTVIWWIFIAWMGVTTLFALYPDDAQFQLERVYKIQLVTFLTLMIMGTKERLNMLIWVIVFSIGFYGVKGGIFTLLHGGAYRVFGPFDSFISDNNHLALALLMTLPLMRYLTLISKNIWIRWGLVVAMILMGVSIVGSYSRGAFIGGFCTALFLWIKSRNKIISGAIIVIGVGLILSFMPQQWHDRMGTIQHFEEDGSARGRLHSWGMTINLASDRLTGGGFNVWEQDVFDRYAVEGAKAKAAHSIYFGILGEHGWIGLGLFIIIGLMAWRHGSWIIKACQGREDLKWLSELAKMVQVSLVAYATGGAFLSLAYYDLYWHLVAILVLGKYITQQHLKESVPAGAQYSLASGQTRGFGSQRNIKSNGFIKRK